MLIGAACQRYVSSARVSPITCLSCIRDGDRFFAVIDAFRGTKRFFPMHSLNIGFRQELKFRASTDTIVN